MFQPQNPTRFVRTVLAFDAVSGVATGALHLAGGAALAGLLQLPQPLLVGSGVAIFGYAACAAAGAWARRPPRWLVGAMAFGNLAWALACGALLLTGAMAPGALGTAFVLVHLVTTLVLADLQWMGLRALRQHPHPAALQPVAGW